MKPLNKYYLATPTVAIVLSIAISIFWNNESKAQVDSAADALPIVKYRSALLSSVSDSQDFTGRLEAVDVVDVRPKVPGTLLTVHFKAGQQVSQNELLFTIDPEPFETEVQRAQANLALIEARQRQADMEFARGQRLLESNSIAQKDFDALDNAVRESAASLKGAQAVLAQARLQLSYTQVRAPIAGRISRAEITAGNVVVEGGTAVPLTRIVSDNNLYASFNVDEQSYLRLIAPSLQAGIKPSVSVALANDDGFEYSATIEEIDNQLDTRSGTLRVRARLDKVSSEMLPGLLARVRLEGGISYDAVMVDDSIVGTDQDRKYILIVNEDNKIELRFVELGALQGKLRVLSNGVAAGEKVIVDGAFRVTPGDKVNAVLADALNVTPVIANGGRS